MPRKTPQYLLTFYQGGDLYRASDDLDRFTVIDNQLKTLSNIVGDGILTGWSISSAGGLDIEVSTGSGFINNVLHRTLSFKKTTLQDNATSQIYLQSNLLASLTGFKLEVESPFSPTVSATFLDSTAPGAPTNFMGTSVEFDVINLFWDENTEDDFDHYEIQRATNSGFIGATTIATPTANGSFPDVPYQDTGLSSETDYFYRIRAVDKSGNASAYSTHFGYPTAITTLADTREPAEPTRLRLFPGNGQIALVFDPSPTSDVTKYYITIQELATDGSIASSTEIDNGTEETAQITGLTNSLVHRIKVQAARMPGSTEIRSSGISSETVPQTLTGPLSVTSLTATPGVGSISLAWTASASASGSAAGQKDSYEIIVESGGQDSQPIDVGLVTSKTMNSFVDAGGETQVFEDDVVYLLKVYASDSFGNLSGPAVAKASTQDVSPPKNVRALAGQAGDTTTLLTWRHSQSGDVVSYEVYYDAGLGFVPAVGIDGIIGYVETFNVTGLPNNVAITFRVRAKDDAGNFSSGVNTVATPVPDTTPPAIPGFVKASPGDQQVRLEWSPVPDEDLDHYVVTRSAIQENIQVSPNADLTILSTVQLNVGAATLLRDIGLTNGQVYAYNIVAVDTRGNASDPSARFLVAPSEGLNESGPDRLESPQTPGAVFSSNKIVVSWQYNYFGATFSGGGYVYPINPDAAPASFNIYRSTDSLVNYSLIDSVKSSEWSFEDLGLDNGQTYYYRVTAVHDNADVLADTGSIQPSNTVFLGTVRTDSGSIASIKNAQRIAANLESTLTEETLARLLEHRHLVSPINAVTVSATGLLAMAEVGGLKDIELGDALSRSAKAYYVSLSGVAVDSNTMYVISPTSVVYNVPFVGDFQVLVNNERTKIPFTLDHDRNAIIFSEALKDADEVSLNGLGLTFYVPTQLDLRFRGFTIRANGAISPDALVDEALQTVRFLAARAEQDAITVDIEPVSPDFGDQEGARQVSLSPDIVVSDFERANDTTYVSVAGGFDEGDSAFVLVNGTQTTLGYTIDFDKKAIVFDLPVPTGTIVALEVRNKEEVTSSLPVGRIVGLDASEFKTGNFIAPQLPDLSHEGRVREEAIPTFAGLTRENGYVFSAPAGALGSATTVYSMSLLNEGLTGKLLLGTSKGFLRSVRGIFLSEGDVANIDEDLSSLQVSSDDLTETAIAAQKFSGRVNEIKVNVNTTSGVIFVRISSPVIALLGDGRIFIFGGVRQTIGGSPVSLIETLVYDPSTQTATQQPSLQSQGMRPSFSDRPGVAAIRLPDDRVLVTGGVEGSITGSFGSANFQHAFSVTVCAAFTPSTGGWALFPSMQQGRSEHSVILIDQDNPLTDVMVCGGQLVDQSALGSLFFDDTKGLTSCERIQIGSSSWRSTGSLNETSFNSQIERDGSIILDNTRVREIYDDTTETWTKTPPVLASEASKTIDDVDGPIKQFFMDFSGATLVVTRNSVYESTDLANFSKMKGLEAVGVVHRVDQVGNALFAATDLGVYEIQESVRANSTWSQGGLIGAGTTETFDLQPLGSSMLAATEIGIFSSSDDGDTWGEVVELEDVFNIELAGDSTLFAQAGQNLYRSIDGGATWQLVATLKFLDDNSIMLSRSPLHLFFGTSTGLYFSTDGLNFSLVEFDLNNDVTRNNVHALQAIGSDVFASYDNVVFAIGPDMSVSRALDFLGTIPTVRVNGEEVRNGFRYDVRNNKVIFERKLFSDDVVSATANYSLYQMSGGGWYEQNPEAPFRVFVNNKEQDSPAYTFDARLGQIAFASPINKYDVVRASIAQTTLKNEGELFHEELEDRLERENSGLALSMGRDRMANLLQLGISIEHNFFERGLERNQYYCLTGSEVDRSFNSFWARSEFLILGRKDYDVFNSTIDYARESTQEDIGVQALVAAASIERSVDEIWLGTDAGIFVIDPTSGFSISETIPLDADNRVAVRDLQFFQGDILAATSLGVYQIASSPTTVSKNEGNGLPESVFAVSVLNNVLAAGTDDAIYFTDSTTDPPYQRWFRASFLDRTKQEVSVSGTCNAMASKDGVLYAAVDKKVMLSTDGKSWSVVFEFQDSTSINKMAIFADMLFLGTNKGVYNDRGTSKASQTSFVQEMLESTAAASQVHINDLYAGTSNLYAVGETSFVYARQDESWTKASIGADAVHEFIETSMGAKVAIANNEILVE